MDAPLPQVPLAHVPAPHPEPPRVVSNPVLIWYAPTTDEPPFPESEVVAKTYVGSYPSGVVIEFNEATSRASIK